MPRFVLLWHECPPSHRKGSHWDFLLEDGAALATWNLPSLPEAWVKFAPKPQAETVAAGQRPAGTLSEAPPNSNSIAAEKIQDHRLAYLDYEGPVVSESVVSETHDGETASVDRGSVDRGIVERLDGGEYRLIAQSETLWRVELLGECLRGVVELRHLHEGNWQLKWIA